MKLVVDKFGNNKNMIVEFEEIIKKTTFDYTQVDLSELNSMLRYRKSEYSKNIIDKFYENINKVKKDKVVLNFLNVIDSLSDDNVKEFFKVISPLYKDDNFIEFSILNKIKITDFFDKWKKLKKENQIGILDSIIRRHKSYPIMRFYDEEIFLKQLLKLLKEYIENLKGKLSYITLREFPKKYEDIIMEISKNKQM